MYIYVDPTDNMNKRTFRGFVTGKYEPRLPKRFIRQSQKPIYPDIDQWAEARLTPAMIVDMYFHKTEFSIPDINDIKQIIDIVESYIEHAKTLRMVNAEIKIYLSKCNEALIALKEAYNGMSTYKKNMYPDLFKTVSDQFAMFYEKLKARRF